MITHNDLINLGYKVKTYLTPKTNKIESIDFIYGESTESQYLVNLSKNGEINIIFPNNDKSSKAFSTSDLSIFIDWHNKQKYRSEQKL